jgi:ABC-2 type transport system ATP-binding protein
MAGVDMVVTSGLTRYYGGVVAVEDVSLSVGEGEIFGLLGPNGAGKTTMVRMLAGLIGASAGVARVAGVEVTDPTEARRARALVGILPEEVGLYGDLTVARTLEFFGRLYQVPDAVLAERIETWLTRFGLWERRDAAAATLSKGLKQRLALARALVHDPLVVLLDEPTANLDPEAAAQVRDVLAELAAAGRSVLVNTHRLDEAERTCDRIGVLRTRLLQVGTPDELRALAYGSEVTAPVTVRLETWDPAFGGALTAIGAEWLRTSGSPNGDATLELTARASAVPDLVAALVAAGARVRAVIPRAGSLEQAYLDLIGDRS